jgi:hypothetical protein
MDRDIALLGAAVTVLVALTACSTSSGSGAPTPPTASASASTSPSSRLELGRLSRSQQDRLFASTLDGFAAVVAEQLDPTGRHLGSRHVGDAVVVGGKGRFNRFVGEKYKRAPWVSASLIGGRYLWRDGGRSVGEIDVTVGADSALPCVQRDGFSVDWHWDCHVIDVPGAERALAGTCNRSCEQGPAAYGLVSPDRLDNGPYRVVSVARSDHLVVTIAIRLPDSAPGPSTAALGAAALDTRLTLPWSHPRFDAWMPPPRIAYAELRAAVQRSFVGPGQKWRDSDYFYARGAYVGQLHFSYLAIHPGGAVGGPCIVRHDVRCETRTVDGKGVTVTFDRRVGAAGVSVEYVGPRYVVTLMADSGIPEFNVTKAVRFVSDDRWQPEWSWQAGTPSPAT